MELKVLTSFFMWCTIINAGILLLTSLVMLPLGDFAYKMHNKFFPMKKETFTVVMYCFIGIYKVLIFVFCAVPWIALAIIS